jgi:hypothetical protein
MTATVLVTSLYVGLLRLYPGRFREEFGAEMTGVFQLALIDAGRRGFASLLFFWLHELITLIPAALSEHLRQWRRTRHTPEAAARFDLRAARWIARVVSLLICGILLDGFSSLTTTPFGLVQIIGLAGLLLAWRWEILGGLLVVTAGVISGLAVMDLILLAAGPDHLLVCLLGGLFWGGPFLIFGWLFIKIGRHKKQLQHHRPGAA